VQGLLKKIKFLRQFKDQNDLREILAMKIVRHRVQKALVEAITQEAAKNKNKKGSDLQSRLQQFETDEQLQESLNNIVVLFQSYACKTSYAMHLLEAGKNGPIPEGPKRVSAQAFFSDKLRAFEKLTEIMFDDANVRKELKSKVLDIKNQPRTFRMINIGVLQQFIRRILVKEKAQQFVENYTEMKKEFRFATMQKLAATYSSKYGQR